MESVSRSRRMLPLLVLSSSVHGDEVFSVQGAGSMRERGNARGVVGVVPACARWCGTDRAGKV